MSGRRGAGVGAPHVLYVAWGYPPSRAGGVYRTLATANAFARSGWRVTVLTVEREAFDRYTGSDPSLEALIDDSIRLLRIPFSWPRRELDIRTYSWLRAHAPALWLKAHDRYCDWLFPERTYASWRPALEKAALRLHAQDPVDLVVASANPHVDFLAGWVLHRKHGVPFVMDYRDAWSLNVFSGERMHEPTSPVGTWEARLIDAAHEIWFVNEPIRRWHAQAYPKSASRMHVVANGFDPELAPPQRHHSPDPDGGLTFGYLGTITPAVPLAELAAGWRWAREHDTDVQEARLQLHGYLGYYSTPPDELRRVVEDAAPFGITYEGPVAKTAIAAVYESFDVLILALGTGKYVTSGKVFEYLATGMPIVSVHDPGNAATDVLRGHPLWFPVSDLSPEAIGKAIIEAAQAARSADDATRELCRAFGARFSRELQLAPRVAQLRADVCGGLQEAAATVGPSAG